MRTLQAFEFMLQPEFAALASLRRALSAWLALARVEERARVDVVLATHEAAANALEHSDLAQPVAVYAQLADSLVTVEISNQGGWKVPSFTDNDRGRGLLLIDKLVSELEIQTDDRGTTLRLLYRT